MLRFLLKVTKTAKGVGVSTAGAAQISPSNSGHKFMGRIGQCVARLSVDADTPSSNQAYNFNVLYALGTGSPFYGKGALVLDGAPGMSVSDVTPHNAR